MNYKELGLKCGIEIHRQIESHKLFCSCPSELTEKEPSYTVMRTLRSVASETGEKDAVANFEMQKGKHAVYEGFHGTTCLIELDEEPIHEINTHALNAVFLVAKMLHMNIVDEIQVMRKQVLDYSNTSGFQRTALVARNGYVETKEGTVGIQTACVEEDAARNMKHEGDHALYRLDRLGIPLIEIATDPDMHDPEQVKDVAAQLGMILKSTGHMKSGLGTIRQDVNISIKGHPRVEIKGVQELRLIPKVVEEEVKRQQENIKKGTGKSEVRRMNPDGSTTFLRPMPSAARMYVETDHPAIPVDKKMIAALKIPELIVEKTIKIEQQYNLSPELAKEVRENELFFDLVNEYKKVEPTLIAKILIEIPKEIKTRFGLDIKKIQPKDFELVVKGISEGHIPKDAALEILSEVAKGNMINLANYKRLDDKTLEREIQELINKNVGISFNGIMGELMKRYKGRIDGKKAAEIIQKLLKHA